MPYKSYYSSPTCTILAKPLLISTEYVINIALAMLPNRKPLVLKSSFISSYKLKSIPSLFNSLIEGGASGLSLKTAIPKAPITHTIVIVIAKKTGFYKLYKKTEESPNAKPSVAPQIAKDVA